MVVKEENSEKQLAREVGALIALRRKARGLTQAQLAEQMEVEKETVSRMETGAISPTLNRLSQLAKLLDCEISDLLQTRSPELVEQALSLLNKMENLSDSQRAVLIQIFGKIVTVMEKANPKERKTIEKFLIDVQQI